MARSRRNGDGTGSKSAPRPGVGGQYVSASSSTWMTRMSVSCSSRWVAKLWRSVCGDTRFLPAAARAAAATPWRGGPPLSRGQALAALSLLDPQQQHPLGVDVADLERDD